MTIVKVVSELNINPLFGVFNQLWFLQVSETLCTQGSTSSDRHAQNRIVWKCHKSFLKLVKIKETHYWHAPSPLTTHGSVIPFIHYPLIRLSNKVWYGWDFTKSDIICNTTTDNYKIVKAKLKLYKNMEISRYDFQNIFVAISQK